MSESESSPPVAAAPRIRLQKFLASCGLGSRRACEEFVTSGRVTIDGQQVHELGTTVDPSRQKIELDGEPLKIERKKYYALYKPRGVVCTNRDPAGRPRVIDMFPADGPRLFPVGRLDEESEGLIVVTNDGDFSQKLAHPKYRIFRTYHVHVAGVPNRPALDQLKQGEHFAEGRFRVYSAKLIKKQGQSSHLEIVLTEGQNREVRRLLARIGHKVMRLKRVSFGPIQLGRLKRGEFRELSYKELADLHGLLDRNMRTPRLPKPPGEGARPDRVPAKTERAPAKAERAAAPARSRPASKSKRRPPRERFERREKPRRGEGRRR
jgi:23S rRNA pseudouridine2605 synthase